MSKLRWALLTLALICVPAVMAGGKGGKKGGGFAGKGQCNKSKVAFGDKQVADKQVDDKKDAQPGARQGGRGRRGQGAGAGAAQFQFQFQPGGRGAPLLSERAMEELKLSAEQKEKVSKIVKDYDAKQKEFTKQLEGLRGGGNVDREKLREAFQASTKARQDATTSIKAVLNDEQKKKFDELTQRRRPGGGGFGGPGGGFGGGFGRFTPGTVLPSALKERLELTDDQKKQIDALEKDLKEKLNKILTEDQKKKLEQGTGRPGGGNRPGARPGQGGGRPGQPGGRPGGGRPGGNRPGQRPPSDLN